jgi:hypothetical protein
LIRGVYERAGVKTANFDDGFVVDWRDGFGVATNFMKKPETVSARGGEWNCAICSRFVRSLRWQVGMLLAPRLVQEYGTRPLTTRMIQLRCLSIGDGVFVLLITRITVRMPGAGNVGTLGC